MTFNKISTLGPQWVSWTPSLSVVCDVSSPTTTQCPGEVSGLTFSNCKYTTHNGQFYGVLNFSIENVGSYPYGGTRNHWDLYLPYPVHGAASNPIGKGIGEGFYYADTSTYSFQGKILLQTFPNLPQQAAFMPIKQSAQYDSWARTNLTYDWNWVDYWNDGQPSAAYKETLFPTNSWAWRRIASTETAWSGSAEAWSAPTPTITASILLHYFLA